MPHFLIFEFFEMSHFSYLILKKSYLISKNSNTKKLGISNYWHVIKYKTEKEPKMKFFDFGAFQKIIKMLSHDKNLFHILFGAFHYNACIQKFYSAFQPISSW